MILTYFIILGIISILTFIAINYLPEIDKSHESKVSLLIDDYCEIDISDLKLVNGVDESL